MNEDLKTTAKDVIYLLRSVQDNSPDNVVRVFFSEKRASEKYRTLMPQVSNELQKKVLMLVLPPLFKALELPVVRYNPVGVLDEENELIIPTQVSSVESFKKGNYDAYLMQESIKDFSYTKDGKIKGSQYNLRWSFQRKKENRDRKVLIIMI